MPMNPRLEKTSMKEKTPRSEYFAGMNMGTMTATAMEIAKKTSASVRVVWVFSIVSALTGICIEITTRHGRAMLTRKDESAFEPFLSRNFAFEAANPIPISRKRMMILSATGKISMVDK